MVVYFKSGEQCLCMVSVTGPVIVYINAQTTTSAHAGVFFFCGPSGEQCGLLAVRLRRGSAGGARFQL